MSDSSLSLVLLKRRLERLEPRREATSAGLFATGHGAVDAALGGGLSRGRLHELFAEGVDAGSGTGMAALFCLRAGLVPGKPARPLLWLRTEGAQNASGPVHATGLAELGLDPTALLLALLPDEAALLRAAAEATRCTELGALLVECWGPMRGLDLTASRRLMLAAEASGVTVILLRIAAPAQGDRAPSAADTRWRAGPAPSRLLEAEAPGAPMFDLELLRRRAGPSAGPWRVEWNRDRLSFQEPGGIDQGNPAIPPLSRPVLPLAAGGALAAQPVRRIG